MRILLLAALFVSGCGTGVKIPEYSTGGRTFPYLVAWKGTGKSGTSVSVAGNFNGNLPALWKMRRYAGGWRVFLHLTNGTYRYRFAEETEDGRVIFHHDPRCTHVFDDGWAPGSRDPKKRNCLYVTASGFVASNGKKLPLRGGIPVK